MVKVSKAPASKPTESDSISPATDEEAKEIIKDSVRVIEIVTSRRGERKTITELYMLADLIHE